MIMKPAHVIDIVFCFESVIPFLLFLVTDAYTNSSNSYPDRVRGRKLKGKNKER